MEMTDALNRIAIYIIPLLFSIVCHEVAHGWVALKQGDNTAAMLGRLTLNPIPHMDPIGILAFVLTSMSGAGFVIGWAKPVPIRPNYFKNFRKGMILVSVAGPLANIILALFFAISLGMSISLLGFAYKGEILWIAQRILAAGITINISLAIFNLLPIPPLDGSRILGNMFPRTVGSLFDSLERYSFIILILILATGVLHYIIGPIFMFLFKNILTIASFGDAKSSYYIYTLLIN